MYWAFNYMYLSIEFFIRVGRVVTKQELVKHVHNYTRTVLASRRLKNARSSQNNTKAKYTCSSKLATTDKFSVKVATRMDRLNGEIVRWTMPASSSNNLAYQGDKPPLCCE